MEHHGSTVALYPLVGQMLKHYRLEAGLGQGGMGVVYRALDTRLQRAVAVKLLAKGLITDPERSKRFMLEARAAARITHPSIAQVYDVDEQDGTVFIAMELVEGRTVRDLVQGGELDLLASLEIATQVAQGLAKAHELGIVHRDIKPANVILTRDGHAKILDFGLAKLMDRGDSTEGPPPMALDLTTLTQTQVGAIKGTPAYMSPEQIKGLPVDARSDLFSLGVMMFEMATGEVPFHRGTMMETMHAVAFDDTPSLLSRKPNLPADLQRIVARCLQKRPEDRPADAKALIQDLRALRRDTESGRVRSLTWRERMGDFLERVGHLRPTQYVWIGVATFGLGAALYMLFSGIGLGGFLFLAFVGLLTYRRLRHQPQVLAESFVRQVRRMPEVRLVAFAEGKFTVSVDRSVGPIYARISERLNLLNRKLFFGHPMQVVIRDDLGPEETRQFLCAPGVQYVRDDVTVSLPALPAPGASRNTPTPPIIQG